MCRLFGFRSTVPAAVHPSLVTEKNSLVQQSREHKDGWGIASYEAGENPLVAHLRLASVGKVEKRNAHPFLHGRWCFVHNGTVRNFARHQAEVESLIRPDLLAHIQGATDSERCFYLFLTRLAKLQSLEGPACVERVACALAETMGLVSAITDLPGEQRSSMNFLVTNGDVMVATRRNRTLFLSDTAPETGKRPHRMHAGPPKPGTQLEQFVLASEQLSGEDHWHLIDEENVVGVDNGLVLHRWKLQDLCDKTP